ncbi:putative TIM-barrel fold metal-dependent hydrolase [Paraburkholderia sp. GAS448]|uniref:amidohydrolase family protein n=1 Tax=Paraburkholderia sp. GAS448 TaxID=3035136 RepID=UPI003D22989C
MKIKYGVVSSDSHGQIHKDAFTQRMSKAKFGDRIPQLVETSDKAHMSDPVDRVVERWRVNGMIVEKRGVSNCAAYMNDPMRATFPQHWEEVPKAIYDPIERLKVLATDGIDGEVLYPNPPIQNATFFQGDAEFELACVQAYNDAMYEEWYQVSKNFIPLALTPYLGGLDVTIAEVRRVAKMGYKGILIVAEPGEVVGKTRGWSASSSWGIDNDNLNYKLPAFADPHWWPFWETCQELDMPVHWHANAALSFGTSMWKGYARPQAWVATAPSSWSALSQFMPNLVFSGVLERFPKLKWVLAESGIGWFNYTLESLDHEWERRSLWKHGIKNRPSERLKEQVHLSSWFEAEGVKAVQIDKSHLMWQSDFPHNPSTFPVSQQVIDRSFRDIPKETRDRVLYKNVLDLYKEEETR